MKAIIDTSSLLSLVRYYLPFDSHGILFNLIKDFSDEEVFIVTEESNSENDLKLFKKIPAICQILDIKVLNLPELLGKFTELDLGINFKK